MIRTGKNIPRTPALQQSNKNEIQDNDEKSAKDEEENKKSGLDPEKIIPNGKSIPRTPAVQQSKKIQEKTANDYEEKKSESADSDGIIPNGKTIPRTPAIQQSNKVQEIQEKCANDEEKQIINVDDIVIKGPNLVEDQITKEKPKDNFIPSGKHALPRTPFIGSNDKNDITDEIESHDESVDYNIDEKNTIKTPKSGIKIDFGIEATQTLEHFDKPKPPPNRSTPGASKRKPQNLNEEGRKNSPRTSNTGHATNDRRDEVIR